MSPFTIFLIVVACGAVVFLAIFLPVYIIRKKYEELVLHHSVSLKTLNEIKGKYTFVPIPNFNMEHTYDNYHYYDNISPEDYLIYELQFIQKEVKKACKDAEANEKEFHRLMNELSKEIEYGVYDKEVKVKFPKMLDNIEQKMLADAFPLANVSFDIRVTLHLSTLHGAHRGGKYDDFNAKHIIGLIRRINQKRGTYFLDEDIYHAICRVERGKVTNDVRFKVMERDGHRCCKCGRKTSKLEIDHIIPISKGGKSTMDNLQTLCHSCNAAKGNKIEY